MGSVRDTEPGTTRMWSYSTSRDGPEMVSTRTFLFAWSMRVTSPEMIVQRRSSRRSGTTACRGEMLPADASGRNG